MKFFLDENIPKSLAKYLTSLDHEIIDIRGSEFEGADDKTLFEMAQKHSAILLTTDNDFFHTIPFLYKNHAGVIVISLKQPHSKGILNRLQWLLKNFNLSEFSNNVILLRDNKYYIKSRD